MKLVKGGQGKKQENKIVFVNVLKVLFPLQKKNRMKRREKARKGDEKRQMMDNEQKSKRDY